MPKCTADAEPSTMVTDNQAPPSHPYDIGLFYNKIEKLSKFVIF